MNRLQPQFYLSFPVVQADYNPVLIDLASYSRLLKNAQFIQYLLNQSTAKNSAIETEQIIHAQTNFLKKQNNKTQKTITPLDSLHLNVIRDVRPFIQFPEENVGQMYLMTEKFFWSCPTTNLGSARHALLLDMQIKGIGRNPLAHRHDHSHSWGGQYIWQGMKSYIAGQLIIGASPLGVLRTPYVALKSDKKETLQIKSSDIGLSIRDADALRVTQVMTSFDPGLKISKESILKNILKTVKEKSIDTHLEQVIFHYATLFLMGLRHMAVTRENITLEGKLIDYEDILIDSDSQIFRFFLLTHKCSGKAPKKPRSYEGDIIYTSTIHLYLSAIMLTVVGFNYLDSSFNLDEKSIKKKFISMIKRLASEVFIVDKSLMSFTEDMLARDALYQSHKTISHKRNINAKVTLKKIQSFNYEIKKNRSWPRGSNLLRH